MLLKYRKSSNPSVFSQKFPAFEAIIYRTGFLDIRYLLGLSIYLLIILAVDILTDLLLYKPPVAPKRPRRQTWLAGLPVAPPLLVAGDVVGGAAAVPPKLVLLAAEVMVTGRCCW